MMGAVNAPVLAWARDMPGDVECVRPQEAVFAHVAVVAAAVLDRRAAQVERVKRPAVFEGDEPAAGRRHDRQPAARPAAVVTQAQEAVLRPTQASAVGLERGFAAEVAVETGRAVDQTALDAPAAGQEL